ncbi:MAG: hypothetical protein ABFE13_07495 [Phycisphaerales bacterium]
MAKKLTLKAPGSVLNRAARKHTLDLYVDPSPRSFLSKSKIRKKSVWVRITPKGGNEAMEPIELKAQVKTSQIRFQDTILTDPARLADLEYLVNDDKAEVEVVIEADSEGELFEQEEGEET